MVYFTKYLLSFAHQDVATEVGFVDDVLARAGQVKWGIWQGLFGMDSTQLLVVSSSAGDASPEPVTQWQHAQLQDSNLFVATARPQGQTSLTKSGIYVFRTFELDAKDIDQAVALSTHAWQTFETSDDFSAEPVALFAPLASDGGAVLGRCAMQLVTWYSDFASWQTSRAADPIAKENFLKRRALTSSTSAVATRLLV